MSNAKLPVSEALDEWVEVFMNRSMRDSMRFWKESGLTMPQISTMMKLRYHGTCSVSDVGSYLRVTSAAASQMIENLVQDGYLGRTEHPDDRRTKQLKLTARGRALIKKSLDARRRWLSDLVQTLSPVEQAEIAAALAHLTRAARELDVEKA